MATTRAKRPEVKIPVKDYNQLTLYCKGVEDATPTSVICGLVSDFLKRDDVKKVIEVASIDKKKAAAIQKKKEAIEKLKAELAELEKGE